MSTSTEMRCARHPKEETALTCASCGTPICPRCMVATPVGMKCPDCGSNRGGVLFQVSPGRFMLAGLTALAAGAVTAVVGGFGFFMIFLSIAYGYFAGGVILKASGMKRGIKMEALAGVGMVVGGLAVKIVPALPLIAAHAPISIILRVVVDPFFLIVLAVATGCAVSKIRYL